MLHRRIAICGDKHSGKSTLFQAIFDQLISNDVQISGFKTYFVESDSLWLEWIQLEHPKIEMGRKTGKRSLKPFFENLDRIGEILLQQDMTSTYFVADELGFLEQFSKTMQRGIMKAISDAPFSIFTMKNVEYPFLKQIREIEGLGICDLGGRDWQQKKVMIQSILGMINDQNLKT